MTMVAVYLAGRMRAESGELAWQDAVKQYVDPKCDFRVRWLDPRDWQDTATSPADYTARDLAAIRECQILFAWMDGLNPSGYGMCLEVGYAHALGRKIVFAHDMDGDWRGRYFDMVRSVADDRAPDLYMGANALLNHIEDILA